MHFSTQGAKTAFLKSLGIHKLADDGDFEDAIAGKPCCYSGLGRALFLGAMYETL